MLTISNEAVQQLKAILAEGGEGSALRVIAMPSGHGLQYMLSAEQEPKEDDLVEEINGLRVLVDTDSAPLLEGTQIDYVEEVTRTGFVISNPNAAIFGGAGACACGGQCSCGDEHAH